MVIEGICAAYRVAAAGTGSGYIAHIQYSGSANWQIVNPGALIYEDPMTALSAISAHIRIRAWEMHRGLPRLHNAINRAPPA